MNNPYPQGYYQQPYGQFQPPSLPQEPQPSPAAKNTRIIFAILVPLAWVIALFLPAYNDDVPGILCLAMGWSMIFTGNMLAFFAWASNILFWISYFMYVFGNKGKVVSTVLSGIGLILTLGALTVSEVAKNEGGMMSPASASIGAYTWIFSYFLLLAGSILFHTLRNNTVEVMPPQIPVQDPYAQYPPQQQPVYPPPPQAPHSNQYPNQQQQPPAHNPPPNNYLH